MFTWLKTVRAEVRRRGEWRGKWGTFWHRIGIARWKWAAQLHKFGDDDRWVLQLFCLWVTLARSSRPPRGDLMDSWGVHVGFGDRCVHLNWGHRTKILHLPWAMEYVREEVLTASGKWVTVEQAGRLPKWLTGYYRKYRRADGRLTPAMTRKGKFSPLTPPEEIAAHIETHTAAEPGDVYREDFMYVYTLESGDTQIRTATVTADRYTWCWRLFWRLGVWFPKKVRTSIDVRFNGEVGEGTGSWKGGVIGSGYDLRPGETPEQSLRRMERERRFTR